MKKFWWFDEISGESEDKSAIFDKIRGKIDEILPKNLSESTIPDYDLLEKCVIYKDFGHAPGMIGSKAGKKDVDSKSRRHQNKYKNQKILRSAREKARWSFIFLSTET